MNSPADTWSEQLSAFMDGELSEAEARFLQRRLEHDAGLRAKWARLHVAASCVKGQPWRPVGEGLCGQVRAGIAGAVPVKSRPPLLRWALAASVAALALGLAPRLINNNGPESAARTASASVPEHLLASPASADFVAWRSAADATAAPAAAILAPSRGSASDFIQNGGASAQASPLPLSAQSPTEFPLVDSGNKRNWPRSELIGAADNPALEAYLVRHNQMLANDGLGGFVPYVDVVASDQSATALGQDGEASQQ